MLGGSSAINGMAYVRGNQRDYDRWENEFGIPGWNFETALKYFKRSEGNQYLPFVQYENGRYHNAIGPQKVDFYGNLSSFQEVLVQAAIENGIPFIDDINADKTTGYVRAQGTQFQGHRWSTAKSYLIPAMGRPNLRVIKHAFVKKILINKKHKAYGVKFDYKGMKMKAFSRKEVILSAGAIMSPVILMNSGIGPRKQLDKYEISVKSDLPVGQNLRDHIHTVIWFRFNATEASPSAVLDNTYNLAVHNSGPFASFGFLLGFINTLNNSIYPDVEILPLNYYLPNSPDLKPFLSRSAYKRNFRKKLLEENEEHAVATVIVSVLQPKSSGYIKLNGTSPYSKPVIRPKYFSNSEDMDVMLRGVKQQISFVDTNAYRSHGGEFIRFPIKECDRFPFRSDDYLKCYIEHLTATDYHPSCTSKMGSNSDKSAVVDPFLRVRNIDGLRQIDAGV